VETGRGAAARREPALEKTAPATPGGDSVVDVPLAGLAPGEYIIEVKAKGEGGEAQELVGFRLSN